MGGESRVYLGKTSHRVPVCMFMYLTCCIDVQNNLKWHNTSIMSIPDEWFSRNGYPGNSGDHNTSIMSIPYQCYPRNGYPGNSGDHKTSIMGIPDECYSRNGYP